MNPALSAKSYTNFINDSSSYGLRTTNSDVVNEKEQRTSNPMFLYLNKTVLILASGIGNESRMPTRVVCIGIFNITKTGRGVVF